MRYGKEILKKLCKEYTDIISENPGVLAGTESADLLLSREAMKIQEDGRLKLDKLDKKNNGTRSCEVVSDKIQTVTESKRMRKLSAFLTSKTCRFCTLFCNYIFSYNRLGRPLYRYSI